MLPIWLQNFGSPLTTFLVVLKQISDFENPKKTCQLWNAVPVLDFLWKRMYQTLIFKDGRVAGCYALFFLQTSLRMFPKMFSQQSRSNKESLEERRVAVHMNHELYGILTIGPGLSVDWIMCVILCEMCKIPKRTATSTPPFRTLYPVPTQCLPFWLDFTIHIV